ncbi:redoxin domain-containing protein [bacterium]|nr:redoxin domain-containing protein [bacterium]MBU1984683.1 redoxin domain-containing protein [bacterium]
MKRISLCALMIVLAWAASAQAVDFKVRKYTPTAAVQAFEEAVDTTSSFTDQRSLAREYRDRYPNDILVQLRAASFLAMDNLDETRAYYANWAKREPKNVIPLYVAGRLMESPEEQLGYAEKILAFDPNSYWGNLLWAAAQSAETDSKLEKSESVLKKAIATDNSLPFAVERLGHLYRARGETQAADEVYVKLGEMQPDRFEPLTYRLMLLGGDHRAAIKLVDEFLKKNPRNIDALYTKARAQRELLDWPAHIETMRRIVEIEPKGDYSYDLACGFSLAGQTDSAFARLFAAVELGFTDVEQYKADEDLIPLRNDPRWTELLTTVEKAEQDRMREFLKEMARTAVQRKEEALSERATQPAPDFTVKDLQGNTVALAGLRGKIVILDFWATWCGPCRKSMPLLDKFYTDSLPEGVVVYGVNVWERGGNTDKVRPFVEERGVHFPILLGDNDLAAAYGVRGIPTLVVIDQEGKIAYRHVGYNPTLPEVLTWQTKELLKTKP